MSEEKLKEKIENIKKQNRNYKILNSEDGIPALIIYPSKNGDPNVRLNGKANNKTGKNNGKAFCGDLSTSFLDFQKSSNTKHEYHKAHSTKENLEELRLIANSTYYKSQSKKQKVPLAVFQLSHLGDQLYELAETLKEEDSKLLFFNSVVHAMAFTIQRKSNGSYVIKFYDPKLTNVHVRILCQDIHAIKYLKISNLLTKKKIDYYFPDHKSAVLSLPGSALGFNQHLATPRITSKFMEANGVVENTSDLLSKFLCYGIKNSEERNISDLITSILDAKEVDGAKKLEMLSAKTMTISLTKKHVTPGLFIALQRGHTDAVRAYVEGVLNSNLKNKHKLALLAAINSDGTPGLSMALQLGHADTVQAYIVSVLSSDLSPEEKMKALIPDSLPSKNYHTVKNGIKKFLSHLDAKQVDKFPNLESLLYIAKEIGSNEFLKLVQDKLAQKKLTASPLSMPSLPPVIVTFTKEKLNLLSAYARKQNFGTQLPAENVQGIEADKIRLKIGIQAILGINSKEELEFRTIKKNRRLKQLGDCHEIDNGVEILYPTETAVMLDRMFSAHILEIKNSSTPTPYQAYGCNFISLPVKETQGAYAPPILLHTNSQNPSIPAKQLEDEGVYRPKSMNSVTFNLASSSAFFAASKSGSNNAKPTVEKSNSIFSDATKVLDNLKSNFNAIFG